MKPFNLKHFGDVFNDRLGGREIVRAGEGSLCLGIQPERDADPELVLDGLAMVQFPDGSGELMFATCGLPTFELERRYLRTLALDADITNRLWATFFFPERDDVLAITRRSSKDGAR